MRSEIDRMYQGIYPNRPSLRKTGERLITFLLLNALAAAALLAAHLAPK